MTRGIAQKRANKAQRRNKAIRERREPGSTKGRSSLAATVRRLAAAPLHCCLLQQELFERGSGMLFLARRAPSGELALAGFLLDIHCLGVKDAFFQQCDDSYLDYVVEVMSEQAPFEAVEPAVARKLLHEAAAYARGFGFEPAKEYAAAELLFGDVTTEGCDAEFEFGKDGKPLYVPGPSETRAQVRQRLEHLRRRLGDEGFDYLVATDGYADDFDDDFDDDVDMEFGDPFDLDEEDLDNAYPYDPETAPDAAEWLALDESERMRAVLAYSRRAELEIPSPQAHAVIVAAVEAQAAAGDQLPVRRAIDRLMGEGLTRRQAVLAVGSVLAQYAFDVAQGEGPPEGKEQETYDAAVEALTAEQWWALAEGGDEDEDED